MSPVKIHPRPAPPLVDLRQVVKQTRQTPQSTPDTNKELIIQQLERLIEQTKQLLKTAPSKERRKHQYRLRSFAKALEAIKEYPEPITSGQQLAKIKGVGKGVVSRIDEILQKGRLSELSASPDKQYQVISQLTGITGIGPSHAQKLAQQGVTSVSDLQKKVQAGQIDLTHHAQVGLKWYHDFLQRIPRSEIEYYETILHQVARQLDPQLKICICGSYRRGLPTSGDIDVLVTHPSVVTSQQLINSPRNYLKELVRALEQQGLIVDHLTTQGKTKYMGVVRLPGKPARRLDIRFVPYQSWAAATLYFTGSKNLNTAMRTHAIERGYRLNEYGLFKLPNLIRIYTPTEQDIFRILRLKYLPPTERNL